MFDTLINQFKQADDPPEQLKVNNQMEWVSWMNNISSKFT